MDFYHQGDKALGDLKDYHVCRVLDNPRVKFEIEKKTIFFLLKNILKLIFIYCCKILFIVVLLQQFYKLIASHTPV